MYVSGSELEHSGTLIRRGRGDKGKKDFEIEKNMASSGRKCKIFGISFLPNECVILLGRFLQSNQVPFIKRPEVQLQVIGSSPLTSASIEHTR